MNQIVNPKHPIPPEVTEGLRRQEELETAAAAQRSEIARLGRPTAEERKLRMGLYESISNVAGLDIDRYRAESSAIAKKQLDDLSRHDLSQLERHASFVPMDFEPAEPVDHSFWAADWNWFSSTGSFTGESQADGIHFRGKKTYDGGDLIFLNFGMKSRYELQANRIPRPERAPWRSAPHVELFGELVAWTGPGGLFEGDRWSKCWLITRQTLYQFVFGPIGPVPRTIGEATNVQAIFFEENHGVAVNHILPGFRLLPAVTLNSFFPGLSIWAEWEIRFDIQLEGNSFFWIWPFDVLIRGFQWPLVPI